MFKLAMLMCAHAILTVPANYISMCKRANTHYQYENNYAFVKWNDECMIFKKYEGEVFWMYKNGEIIMFPQKEVTR